jgi:hypothetical protein
MPKVRGVAMCFGGIIKCNHAGIKITNWPTSVVPLTYRRRWAFSGVLGLLPGMYTCVWKRAAL